MIFGNTRAVADKLLRDIRRIAFGVSLGVQILFLAYYGWSIYSNIDSLPFLIIYASLAVIAIVSFINFLVISKHKEKKNKKFNRFLRVLKYIINGAMLAVNAYQLFKYTRTDLQIILLGLSGIFWLANIVIEIIRVSVEYYFNLFKVAIKADAPIFINTIDKVTELSEKFEELKKHPKGTFWEAVDAPFEAWANKIRRKEKEKTTPVQAEIAPTATEKAVQQLAESFEENQKEKKQKQKEENRKQDNEKAEKEKKALGAHLKTIWEDIKPKKKKN